MKKWVCIFLLCQFTHSAYAEVCRPIPFDRENAIFAGVGLSVLGAVGCVATATLGFSPRCAMNTSSWCCKAGGTSSCEKEPENIVGCNDLSRVLYCGDRDTLHRAERRKNPLFEPAMIASGIILGVGLVVLGTSLCHKGDSAIRPL